MKLRTVSEVLDTTVETAKGCLVLATQKLH